MLPELDDVPRCLSDAVEHDGGVTRGYVGEVGASTIQIPQLARRRYDAGKLIARSDIVNDEHDVRARARRVNDELRRFDHRRQRARLRVDDV